MYMRIVSVFAFVALAGMAHGAQQDAVRTAFVKNEDKAAYYKIRGRTRKRR